MKKRVFRSICLILALLMAGSLLAACGNNQTAPPAAPADPGAPASPAGDGRVFTVDAAYAAGEPVTRSWTGALNEIERRSDGRITFNHHYAGSLLTFPEIPRGMLDGVAQWAYLPSNNFPDVLPLSCRIMQMPFMGLRDALDSAEIMMQLMDEFPEIAEEFAQFNMVPLSASPLWAYHLHLIDDDEVRLPQDLAGRAINPFKPELQSMFESFNVGTSYIPPGQMFETLERAVLSGYVNTWAFAQWFGLHPFLKQHVIAFEHGFYQEFFFYVVAKDFYESLPADLQQMWHDVFRNEQVEAFGGLRGYEFMWEETKSFIDWQINYARENDNLFVELTPQEAEVWKEAMAYTHELVLNTINEQRGDQVATAIYNRAIELITQKYGA